VIEDHQVLWKVQLWLDDRLIEEHIAPPELAEQYANVIRLRIRNLPGRRLRCEPVSEPELAYALNDRSGR
jgi:methionine synthase II (cobalamin-independent)